MGELFSKHESSSAFLNKKDSCDSVQNSLCFKTKEPEGMNSLEEFFPEIIRKSKEIELVLGHVKKIARTQGSVLILGESGTGKELIASAIHRLSPRADQNFVAINCSAIPEDLLEAELFGHEKGAFTGADKKRNGLLSSAHKGTLFLDEIGDMPLRLQAKILRVIQELKFSPLGSSQLVEVDIRFIAATNKNLAEEITKNNFRLDLFYRLNVLPVFLPPLRERTFDILPLIHHFSERYLRLEHFQKKCWFEKQTLECLERYSWPGNVRQLQNVVERMLIINDQGPIQVKDLPEEIILETRKKIVSQVSKEDVSFEEKSFRHATQDTQSSNVNELPKLGLDLTQFIEELENSLIMQALERSHYNKNKAAKLLGLNRTTLVERIKKRKLLE